MNLKGNLLKFRWLPIWNSGNNRHAEDEMENDSKSTEESVERFRDYAAECRRLAQRATEKDRKVLMEIAEAWMKCAEEAERKANSSVSEKKG